MANSDDRIRPPAQELPDELAEVRQRRQKHAGSRPSARRSTPQKSISRDPSPPDGVKGYDRERRLTGAMVNGGLGIDEPAPDDVLDAMTGAPTFPAAPPIASGTTPDDAVDARVAKAAESAGTHITDAPEADNWLRHHHERRQPQRNEPNRPRGSAELPTEPTRAVRGRPRVPARPRARPKATATKKPGGRSRRASRWVIAIVLAMAVLVVAGVVIADTSGGHTTRTGRLTAARVLSDGWHGGDPRSSEHPALPEPVEFRSARVGAAALTARRYVATRIHHPSAPATPASSSASSVSVPAGSSDQPTEVTPAPETTYTPPPATTTTAPTPSTGSDGGGGSPGSGSSASSTSSSSSSTKKTPAYGPAGSLGPGSSPDS